MDSNLGSKEKLTPESQQKIHIADLVATAVGD
jgi:hypothetical protein